MIWAILYDVAHVLFMIGNIYMVLNFKQTVHASIKYSVIKIEICNQFGSSILRE